MNIANNLHLVDFDRVSPTALAEEVTQAIDEGNQFLDTLDSLNPALNSTFTAINSSSLNASDALADIIEFDHLNLKLDRNWGIVSHLNSVMSNDDIRQVHHDLLPKLSAFGTRVGQHKPLYNRYLAVHEDSDFFASLEPSRQRAITLALQRFELSGVALPSDQQSQYADIQNQLSTLSAKFSDNILDATQAFDLPLTKAQLSGISDSGLAMLAQAGEQYKAKQDKAHQDSNDDDSKTPAPLYVATLDIPVYLAIMTHADDRDLREQMYKAYVTRASEHDEHTNKQGESLNNADNMAQILKLRTQKATLLGFDNYAELSLSTKMADSVPIVEDFLRQLAEHAKPSAQKDLNHLKQKADELGLKDLQPWDTAYVAEKLKQDKFNLSQEEIRPYFPLPTVIDGLFNIVNRLYGIKAVQQCSDVSLWHDDVRFYHLYDSNNLDAQGNHTLIGAFYFDLFARVGKRGGAWMSGFQSRYSYENNDNASGSKQDYHQLPVCFMVGNFTPPNGDQPSLLTHSEVTTLFHEFGHGLHHLLTAVTVGDVAGVNGVEWDAVELPSQIMENWAWDAQGIALISSHVDTDEPLPQEKLDALLNAKNFQSGMQTLRQIEFALFDLLIHAKNPAPNYEGILTTLDSVRSQVAVMPTPQYNRFANGFSHIFAGGYAAGYYSYKWAELLSADAFSKFEAEGIFNPAIGKAFRDTVLSVGGSLPAKTNFENFIGRSASIEALLRHSGFKDSA